MTAETHNYLLDQADQAFSAKDARTGLTYILQLLTEDFTYDPAWQLLHRMMSPQKPFHIFQMDVAEKYFPQKVHLLVEKEFSNQVQSNDTETLIQEHLPVIPPAFPAQPAPEKPSERAAASRFCPQCGKERNLERKFCSACGFNYLGEVENQAGNPVPKAAAAAQDAWMKQPLAYEAAPQPLPVPQPALPPQQTGSPVFNLKYAFLNGLAAYIGGALGLILISHGNVGIGLVIGFPAGIFGFLMGGFFIKPKKKVLPTGTDPGAATGSTNGLVIGGWVSLGLSIFMGLTGIISPVCIGFAVILLITALVLAVLLIRSPQARTHGWIILGIGGIVGLIDIMSLLSLAAGMIIPMLAG